MPIVETIVTHSDLIAREIAGSERSLIELSVVVPTFNERENISPLLSRLETALEGIGWEVIFVDDDSPDRTAKLVRQTPRRSRVFE